MLNPELLEQVKNKIAEEKGIDPDQLRVDFIEGGEKDIIRIGIIKTIELFKEFAPHRVNKLTDLVIEAKLEKEFDEELLKECINMKAAITKIPLEPDSMVKIFTTCEKIGTMDYMIHLMKNRHNRKG
jgi:hypothetical protein